LLIVDEGLDECVLNREDDAANPETFHAGEGSLEVRG
jgi:hypothetical protein